MDDVPNLAAQTLLEHGLDLASFLKSLIEIEVPWIESADSDAGFPDDAVWVGRSPPVDANASVLVLNNKAAGKASVTRLVTELGDAELSGWPLWSKRPMCPADLFDRVTLVVEDASPDSVWGVIVLLARAAQCDLGEVTAKWLPVVERWETDGTANRPSAEWPALAAALAHARFGPSPSGRDTDYKAAWTAMLRFAGECLQRQLDPLNIGDETNFPLLQDARATLEQEEQAYRDWLSHAHKLQLSLPLRQGVQRRMLVDALLFVEDELTGAAKSSYRNDRMGSPLGHGFTFAAAWRPSAPKGSGNDITITVDPRRGVGLRELWEELERREDAAWADNRPCWNPRDPARLGPANEPWFLNENETLIAAPRIVQPEAADAPVPGSKLSWSEVSGAIWRIGNPLRQIVVAGIDGGTVPLLDLPPEAGCPGDKLVRLARWHPATPVEGAVPARSLGASAIVDRILAAVAQQREGAAPLEIAALPSRGDWSRVELAGGFAIVTATGVLVLDDWRESAHPELRSLREVCLTAASIDYDLRVLEQTKVNPLSSDLSEFLSRPRTLKERPQFAVRAAGIAVVLAELRSRQKLPGTRDAVVLQEMLNKYWGLDKRLTQLEQQVRAVMESSKALGDSQMRRLTQYVALYGFPFYLASGIAKPLAQGLLLFGAWLGLWTAPIKDGAEPPTWSWWLCFAAVLVVAIRISFHVIQRDSSPASQQGDRT